MSFLFDRLAILMSSVACLGLIGDLVMVYDSVYQCYQYSCIIIYNSLMLQKSVFVQPANIYPLITVIMRIAKCASDLVYCAVHFVASALKTLKMFEP